MPSVAIVGRPNVGKSSLVNRLAGSREAVVAEAPGVTRDRKVLECEWLGRKFAAIDTGGWVPSPDSTLAELVCVQAELAMASADGVVLVVDVTTGITEEDALVAERLRRADVPVLVAVNKVDNAERQSLAAEFYSLGFENVVPVSALHGHGSGDLLDLIVEAIRAPESDRAGDSNEYPAVAIVGRPNAGKSTLFNKLAGEERSIVDDAPGTTRDTVDTDVTLEDGRRYRFVDTAGMRRKAKVGDAIEYYGGLRAESAIDRSDVVLLVIDAESGPSQQDQRLAERVISGGCGVVVVLTKWDLLDDESKERAEEDYRDRFRFMEYAPMIRISGLTGRGVHRVFDRVDEVVEAYETRISTGELNRVIADAGERHPAPLDKRGVRPRVIYATQAAIRPPTFVLFSNRRFEPSYLKYLERSLRQGLGIGPTPIRIRVRPREKREMRGSSRSRVARSR